MWQFTPVSSFLLFSLYLSLKDRFQHLRKGQCYGGVPIEKTTWSPNPQHNLSRHICFKMPVSSYCFSFYRLEILCGINSEDDGGCDAFTNLDSLSSCYNNWITFPNVFCNGMELRDWAPASKTWTEVTHGTSKSGPFNLPSNSPCSLSPLVH